MIDLYSDTKTRPTAAMRAAMAAAEVGDEAAFEDPTVNELCSRVAARLGKEAALFTPSGTMCNQIALAVHCLPGDEVICEASCHIVCYEAGGAGANAGVNLGVIHGRRGQFEVADLEQLLRPALRHSPRQRLLAVEQTCNMGGGSVWPLDRLDAVAAWARAHGLVTHMDGARLFNAEVATGVPAARQAQGYDSVWVDFSKGLGAPVGAVLAGSAEFIERAWRVKQRLGGAMRQAGIIAAGALYALEHHVERLAIDHRNAQRLALGLAEIPGVRLDPASVETNIVLFEVEPEQLGLDAPTWAARAHALGVRIGAFGRTRLRAVTHLEVDAAAIDRALERLRQALRA